MIEHYRSHPHGHPRAVVALTLVAVLLLFFMWLALVATSILALPLAR